MAYMLSELVQYTIARSSSHEEVISRLMNAGFEVGRRAVEIVSFRCCSCLSLRDTCSPVFSTVFYLPRPAAFMRPVLSRNIILDVVQA